MGDFNAILAPDLARPSAPKYFLAELKAWAQALGVDEVSRWKHPTERAYSCFSTTHKTTSRIDLAFANPSLMSDILEAVYLPSGLSDHNPLKLTICSRGLRTSALRRLGHHWIAHPEIVDKIPPPHRILGAQLRVLIVRGHKGCL